VRRWREVRGALGSLAWWAAASSGCLVLSLQPAYDDRSIRDDPALVGTWVDEEDKVSATLAAGEWRSFRVTFTDAFGTREFTGYLTEIDGVRVLDVMPERGKDAGPLLVPTHTLMRIAVHEDALTVEALSYDWLAPRVRRGGVRGLTATMDQRGNVVITSPTRALRAWIAKAPPGAFGAPARFVKKGSGP
jgi:hypothetical protein